MSNQSINLGRTFVPTSSTYSPKRIEEVKAKHDILGRATAAGRKNEPRSEDVDLDEHQRVLVDETQGFVASVTRLAGAEITQRTNAARALLPYPLDTGLERANIGRQVAEAKDLHRDDLETALKHQQRALRDLRTFEEDNGLGPFSAIYKDDRAMFFALLAILMLGESVFNAFSFEELQDRGLLGGLMLALSVGVANVVMGLGAGFLGFRLMIHRQPALRLLGIGITGVLLTAALALHLALGDLREAISHDAKAQIDFLVILKPWRWFAYSSIPPFVLFAVGLATFFVAALKGRGGSWGIVAPYWQHEVMDRRFRAADRVLEDARANLKNGLQNGFDGELAKLRARLETETANVGEIRRLVSEAQGIERTMNDSIADEIGRQHIWQRTYRDRNRAVRTTPAPAYFDSYPEFEDLRKTRLDVSDLYAVAEQAEKILAQNRSRLAELQQKILTEQTATIEAMLTMVSSAERRAAQQINKDDAFNEPRLAQRAE
ncbi:MAG: hypothetical protein SFW65_04865 [Alphaproteobacteria bacterium]|nr:hypothetical protein [Alphaproteobacteria bacterium]